MNRSLIETVMGAVVLIVAALFVMFVYDQRNVAKGDGYDVTARFDNVTGIAAGSDVRIGGIKVGTITAMEIDPATYRATVSMRLKPEIQVPDDSSASIVSEGLLGGKFVQLVPGADDRMLEQGGEILYTQSSVNLEEMIGKFMFSGGGVEGGTAGAAESGAVAEAPAPESYLD